MDLMEAVRARHSVRNYTDRPIEGEVLKALEEEIAACNREAGLHSPVPLTAPWPTTAVSPVCGTIWP